jgi:hypothetical protein
LALGKANRADTVELINGDRYSGTVLSVSLSNVSLRSEIQGLVVLPREKVSAIAFGPATAKTNVLQSKAYSEGKIAAWSKSNASPALAQAGISLNSSNLVAQVQNQLLAGAGPEATQKYNQMVADFLNGKLSIPEIRKQAQQALSAVDDAKQDLDPEMADLMEGYLSVLRAFLQEAPQK